MQHAEHVSVEDAYLRGPRKTQRCITAWIHSHYILQALNISIAINVFWDRFLLVLFASFLDCLLMVLLRNHCEGQLWWHCNFAKDIETGSETFWKKRLPDEPPFCHDPGSEEGQNVETTSDSMKVIQNEKHQIILIYKLIETDRPSCGWRWVCELLPLRLFPCTPAYLQRTYVPFTKPQKIQC